MARVLSPFPISGSVGDLTFATNGKTTYLKMKNWIPKDRWLTSPRLQRTRENAQTFGGAAKVGAAIYSTLTGGRKRSTTPASQKLLRPYGHNHITRRLVGHGSSRRGRAADSYTFIDVLPALRGLDLSHDTAPSHAITITPLGSHHAPDKFRVQGIHDAAAHIDLQPGQTLEFRLQVITIRYPEVTWNAEDRLWNFTQEGSHLIHRTPWTEWIPISYVPEEGVQIPVHYAADQLSTPQGGHPRDQHPTEPDGDRSTLNSHPDGNRDSILNSQPPSLTFFQLEWLLISDHGPAPKSLPHQAITRLAAISYPQAMAQQIAAANHPKRPTKATQAQHQASPRQTMTPEAYLMQALAVLTRPTSPATAPPPDHPAST